MRRGPKPPVRSWVATLCVALSVVFAGSSAANLVDSVQHAAQAPHEHAVQLTLVAAEDAPADHQNGGARSDPQPAPNDHQTGPGHHHVDGPAATLGGAGEPSALVSIHPASLPGAGASGAKSVRPGGLKRPPKAIATRV